ncbi:MAG TPA: glycosyltransferase family 2 protein [Actinomycetota bacterium]
MDRLDFSLGRLLVLSVLIGAIWLSINAPLDGALNWYLTFAWSFFLPLVLIGLLGGARVRDRLTSRYEGQVSDLVIFLIPTVARRDVLPALHRVVDSVLLYAPANLRRFRVDLVVDEGSDGIPELEAVYGDHPLVRILVVPKEYETPGGAIHKARATHYALLVRDAEGESGPDVFVYHLDDDTGVGGDTISSIAEFIADDDGTYDLAQGVLAFPHHLASSTFCAYADSIRPGDDVTRFRFFTGVLGKPLGGLHGEHLLVRASVESEIGWDFGGTKVEDAHFAMRFAARGHRSKALDSCSYGASPSSLRDLITQRRRWASGLIQLIFDRSIPLRTKPFIAYSVLLWITGFFYHPVLMLALASAVGPGANTSPVLAVVTPIWAVNLAFILTQYLEGLRVNLATTQGRPRRLRAALLMIPGFYVFTAVEAYAAALGLKDAILGRRDFQVIRKPV